VSETQAGDTVVYHARSGPLALAEGEAGDRSSYGKLTTKLAFGSAAALVVYIAGAGLTYCAQLALTRTIGANGYGVYAYVFAWVTALAYISALGFDVSLMRFVPAYLASRAFGLLRGVTRFARQRVAGVGCSVAVLGVVAILAQWGELSRDLGNTFVVGFALVPIMALVWVGAAVVRGFGGVLSALAPDRTVRDGVLLGFVVLAWACLGWRIDAAWAMAATLLGAAAGLGLVSIATHRYRPSELNAVAPVYDVPTWRSTSLPLVVIGMAEAPMNRTGVMLLGWMVDTRDAGIYALTFNLAFAVVLPRTAVNTLLAPTISDLFVRNAAVALRAIVAKAAWWSLLGALGIALPLSLFAEPFLKLFGPDFQTGAPALRILLLGQVIAAAAGSQLHLMTMTGRERSAALQLVFSAVANAAAAAALVTRLGPTGAALAAAAALIGWNAAMCVSIRRHLSLWPGVFAARGDRFSRGEDVAA